MFNAITFLTLVTILNLLSNSFVNTLCVGKYQLLSNDQKRYIYAIAINRFSLRPTEVTWENNGQTVVIRYKFEKSSPTINYGPFGNETYRLEFMYYNWLNATGAGHEGTNMEENTEFPAELHVVFVNTRYANYQRAVTNDLAIVVASVKHTVVEDEVVKPTELFYDPFDKILTPNSKVEIPASKTPYIFEVFVFEDLYYMYVGKSIFGKPSVCSADVIWLEFIIAKQIGRKQVQSFRKLMSFNDVPLMSKINQFNSPNTTIYQSIDPYTYNANNWTAKHFEGFHFALDSASVLFSAEKITLLIVFIHVAY